MAESATQFATHFLESSALPAARRLELSRQFSIHHWVPSAFEQLLNNFGPGTLSEDDAKRIGFKTYQILTKARELIDTRRKASGITMRTCNISLFTSFLAQVVPALMDGPEADYSCADHNLCQAAWKETWKKKISKRLTHPTDPLPLHGVVDVVISAEIPGLSYTCKNDLVDKILTHEGFQVEKRILLQAIEAVVKYNKSL
jgi:hypothetical protein